MQNDNRTILNLVLDVGGFVGYVTKIIRKLLERNNGNTISSLNHKFVHICIELLKDGEFDCIQITNCGSLGDFNCSNIIDISELLRCEISGKDMYGKSAFVYYKTVENNHEIIYDLRQMRNDPIISDIIHFPHLKEYLSIKIEHKFRKKEIKQLSNSLIERLNHLVSQYPNIKYTFYAINGELLYTNLVEFDHTYTHCHLMSSAITRILRLSLNNEFRDECFKLLNIDHSEMANDAIMNTLLSLFHDNYQV